MPIRNFFLAISVPCLWGIGFVITKPGMEQFPPMLINGLRWSLTGLVLVWWFPMPKGLFLDLFKVSFIGSTLQYGLTYNGLNSGEKWFPHCKIFYPLTTSLVLAL